MSNAGDKQTWAESELVALKARIQGLPDAEIVKMLTVDSHDYRPEALLVGQEEAKRRQLDLTLPVANDTLDQQAEQDEAELPSEQGDTKNYPGIRRGWYFLCLLVIGGLTKGLRGNSTEVSIGWVVVPLALWIVLIIARLRNVGKSGWWSLLLPVPIANIVLGAWCFAYPEGYQEEKRIDKAGKIILCLYAAWVCLLAVVFVVGVLVISRRLL